MVDESVVGVGVTDSRVVKAMLDTPRHEFVPPEHRASAYFDMSLPIGEQQTISSPFIVAYMTQSIDPQPTDKVLEIGTGSGYQAAVLSPLVKHVYTIEIVESLGKSAAATLERLKYKNVTTKIGDGYLGWPEHAPFDKIIVTCSPEKAPQPLVDQLKEGGLMVIPVGERYQQTLYLLRKKDGKLESEALLPTLFVPMTGRAEDAREVRPDPAHPEVVNGGFEKTTDSGEFVPGWYYERLFSIERDDRAPEGRNYVAFRNRQAGRSAHLLQGLAIDGSKIERIELSAWVKTNRVLFGKTADDVPLLAISLYDGQRKELGLKYVGPFQGTEPWRKVSLAVEIPEDTREALVRIGLFGATGEIGFDDVKISSHPRQ